MTLWQRLTDDREHGSLAALLLVLTFASGIVDAVSFLSLGHVFVAAMTGNLLFIAFAFAGEPGFSVVASLVALGAFVGGSVIGGHLVDRARARRQYVIAYAAAAQLLAMAVGAVVLGVSGSPPSTATTRALVALLGLAMGAQMTAVRSVGIREVTTTVLTTTLSTLVAEVRETGSFSASAQLSSVAIVTEVVGALAGALLLRDVDGWSALALGAGCAAVVVVVARKAPTSKGPLASKAP